MIIFMLMALTVDSYWDSNNTASVDGVIWFDWNDGATGTQFSNG